MTRAGTPRPGGLHAARRALPVACVALSACVMVPQTREVYDPDCRMLTRQMTLEAAVLGSFHSCAGDACVAMLAAAGAVTAASAVISGSIVLVGNVVYWFERQGQCARSPAPPAAPVSGARPAA